jgi:hypothetical protein
MVGCLYLRMEGTSTLRDLDALIDSHILMIKYRGDTTSIIFQVFFLININACSTRDGNRYKISADPRIPNPMGVDMGLSLCP